MKIRCVIDGITLHDMALAPAERRQLERTLHAALTEQLRAGWSGIAPERLRAAAPAAASLLRLDLAPSSPQQLARALAQSLTPALMPASTPASTPALTRSLAPNPSKWGR